MTVKLLWMLSLHGFTKWGRLLEVASFEQGLIIQLKVIRDEPVKMLSRTQMQPKQPGVALAEQA